MKVGVYLHEMKESAGGGYTLQETIANYLLTVKSRHEFIVFYRGQLNLNKYFSIKFVNLGATPLADAVKEHHIDIVWFVTLTYEKVDIPFILPVWDLQHRIQPFFPEVSISGWNWDSRENFYRYILPRAAYVITATEAGRNEIHNFYQIPNERIKKIPLPVPSFALEHSKLSQSDVSKRDEIILAKYSKVFGDKKDFLFYPSQFWPHKNHIGVLLALKILKEKYSLDFSVVFTGSDHGNKKYIQEKVSELELADDVHFLGLVSFETLSWLYRKAFALIFPTFFGPDNLPPLEAFALGCPVIASNVSGAGEQLGDAAILIDPKREDEIADAVKRLYDNPDLRQKLIKRGQARVIKLQENSFMDNIISVLDEFEPVRRCWSNKEIYQYVVRDETIAEEDIQSSTPIAISNAAGEIDKINKLLNANDIESAARVLNEAIKKYPDSPDLLNLQAILKLRMKDTEGAKSILFDLIKNQPTYYPAYVNLACVFWDSGDTGNAMKYFEEALKTSNYDRAVVMAYGEMLMSYKKYAHAKEIFERYRRMHPDDSEVQVLFNKCEGILGKVKNLGRVVENI